MDDKEKKDYEKQINKLDLGVNLLTILSYIIFIFVIGVVILSITFHSLAVVKANKICEENGMEKADVVLTDFKRNKITSVECFTSKCFIVKDGELMEKCDVI